MGQIEDQLRRKDIGKFSDLTALGFANRWRGGAKWATQKPPPAKLRGAGLMIMR